VKKKGQILSKLTVVEFSPPPTKSFAYWLGKHSKNFLNPIGFRKHFSPLARPKETSQKQNQSCHKQSPKYF
jgi:hypothetical protein